MKGGRLNKLKDFKKVYLIAVDAILINVSYLLSLYFRFTLDIPNEQIISYRRNFIIITVMYIAVFYVFKLYDSLLWYASIDELTFVVGACIAADLLSIICGKVIQSRLPYSVSILAGIISVLLIGGFRISFRIYRRSIISINNKAKKHKQKVMIIGAGAAGAMIIKDMKHHHEMKYEPVVLIDDDKRKLGTSISRIRVMGTRKEIVDIAREKEIEIILIAIPSIDNKNKKEIIDICKETGCKVQIVPSIYEVIDGKVSLSKIRNVDYEDLLGREPIKLDMNGIERYIKDRVVLITGGGGSIGSELCRQVNKFSPKEIIILDNYENGVYELQNEFKYNHIKVNLKTVIASIRDRKRLENIFKEYKPEIVFHAAAHKHVPLMEDNPVESIKNNVFGTLNLAECADMFGVKRFVMISTDKAVNPTNIMGASKRVCEMIIQSIDKKSATEFVSVRFGNVLGSNGSVVPIFKNQIAHGGPVTVTHPEINRFFMTIPEAAQLVLQAGAFAKGGEIFVLDMEKPVKIYDLACDLIRLSGLEPNVDIKIEFIGLRPGEKLYEEVLTEEEGLGKTQHNKIFVGKPTYSDFSKLKEELNELREITESDNKEEVIQKIEQLVPTYNRNTHEEVATGLENN